MARKHGKRTGINDGKQAGYAERIVSPVGPLDQETIKTLDEIKKIEQERVFERENSGRRSRSSSREEKKSRTPAKTLIRSLRGFINLIQAPTAIILPSRPRKLRISWTGRKSSRRNGRNVGLGGS
ncbi:hypothetical protein [Geothermobacter hydrogeniphilus]|uniref:Uncharacterized protein n=1 Tax=Geothermobacter hydrogeniphilus TaxID=1969733 RepID=A0A1X0Y829_9BACT|nr:hypothetical protein [Geothermobacter hydrogeniphilus]ORJ61360.1 hypothetical protein B5V00_06930 [Geothermobacter hydrogeniphilus]